MTIPQQSIILLFLLLIKSTDCTPRIAWLVASLDESGECELHKNHKPGNNGNGYTKNITVVRESKKSHMQSGGTIASMSSVVVLRTNVVTGLSAVFL